MLKTKTIDIQAIDHIVIRAHDLSRMVAFYRDVLGCEVERESDKFELVQLRAGNALIDLMGSVKPEEGGNAHPPLSRTSRSLKRLTNLKASLVTAKTRCEGF